IEAAGMDPDNLPVSDPSKMNFGSGGNTKAKAWKDIWGSGQGIGTIKEVGTVEDLVARFEREYHDAKARMLANSHYTPWGALAEAAE
ncbi:MAG: nitronate monooxygenase, partial [Erythrobacter sp.]|nr:nitronate monooxygenase [Erythrobacter sp.]